MRVKIHDFLDAKADKDNVEDLSVLPPCKISPLKHDPGKLSDAQKLKKLILADVYKFVDCPSNLLKM